MNLPEGQFYLILRAHIIPTTIIPGILVLPMFYQKSDLVYIPTEVNADFMKMIEDLVHSGFLMSERIVDCSAPERG